MHIFQSPESEFESRDLLVAAPVNVLTRCLSLSLSIYSVAIWAPRLLCYSKASPLVILHLLSKTTSKVTLLTGDLSKDLREKE
jgi:hypothetical protein